MEQPNGISFEGALKRIEEIISALEEEDMPLKDRIESFKEGAGLLKFCEKELKEAEMSIQKIVEDNGDVRLEDFDSG